MISRRPLRKQLIEAWRLTMEEAYSKQLINSERGLQFHFCQKLLAAFDENTNRRIFIEPGFKDRSGQLRSPDVVICNTNKIIGVIELKYMPKVTAEYVKDLKTLAMFADKNNEFELSNHRYRGHEIHVPKQYILAPDAVLCWAGVYHGPKVDIEDNAELIGESFLCLHAVTASGKCPSLFYSNGSASTFYS